MGGQRRHMWAAFWQVLVTLGLCVPLAWPVAAADIWVRAGADGDGSRDRPFGTLWRPLRHAVRGDVIHVAEGVYTGRSGSGAFVVKVARLTLVGGYSADFSERDPFRHLTVLERAVDFEGDWNGLPEAIIAGQQGTDHHGLVIDGFVLDSASRNTYGPDGSLDPKQSWKGPLIETYSPNLSVRNCTLLNPYGEGISSIWQGDGNEVTNTFVVSSFHAGISTRSAQPGSVVRVSGCTIAFTWFEAGKGGGMGVLVGREGTTIVERSVIAFAQTEQDEAGCAVANPLGNDQTVLRDNVFFLCQGGLYRYMDAYGRSQLVEAGAGLDKANQEPAAFALAEASGNQEADPKLRPERDYFESFSNLLAAAPGRLDLRRLGQLRAALHLPFEADPASPRRGWAVAYPRDQVVPNLVSRLEERGVQTAGPFAEYRSQSPKLPVLVPREVGFDAFARAAPGVSAFAGSLVRFRATLGPPATAWLVAAAPRTEYSCVRLLKPGEPEATRSFVYAYLRNGSEAAAEWRELYPQRGAANGSGGVWVSGRAFYAASDSSALFPVVIIIERIDAAQ